MVFGIVINFYELSEVYACWKSFVSTVTEWRIEKNLEYRAKLS